MHLQAVRGFGQIAAQKKQLGLLPAVQPPTASVFHQAEPDAQQQQQQEQQPPSAVCCTSMLCQADHAPATASNQQQAEPDEQAGEPVLPSCAVKADCSSSATHVRCTASPGQEHGGAQAVPQIVPQVVPQVVLQSATADAPQPKARGLGADLLFSPQQMPVMPQEASNCTSWSQQESAALQAGAVLHNSGAKQPAVGYTGCQLTQAPHVHIEPPLSGPSDSSQAKAPQVQSQLPDGLAPSDVTAVVKMTTAIKSKQAPRQKRPSATAQHAGKQASKRAKPAATRAASGAGPRTAPRGQSGKATKLSACGSENAAGRACAAGKACPAGEAGPGLLSSPPEQPSAPLQQAVSQAVTRRSLRVRKSAPVIVDDSSAEEDGSSSDYTDKASASACDPADDSLHAGGSHAAYHARIRQQLAADSLPESSDISVVEVQTHGRQMHQEEQSVVSSSGTDADSDVECVTGSPEQPAAKAGKRKRASSRVGIQKPAVPQHAKRDSAGPETGQQPGTASASRGGRASANKGGRSGKRTNARQNFVRCNLKASF